MDFSSALLLIAELNRRVDNLEVAHNVFVRVTHELADPMAARQGTHVDWLGGRAYVGLAWVDLKLEGATAIEYLEEATTLLLRVGPWGRPHLEEMAIVLEKNGAYIEAANTIRALANLPRNAGADATSVQCTRPYWGSFFWPTLGF